MNIKEFSEEIKRTTPDLGSSFNNQLHMVLGISTEAGELLDVYKKAFAYGKKHDIVNISEEIGDLFWYVINLCDMLELDPHKVMEACVEKLKVRYPVNFTSEQALNRNLTAERKVLEGISELEFLE